MSDYGIKVSSEGTNIDSTDPKDYIIWSKYSNIRIVQQGFGTFVGAGNATGTITHNLGYVPLVFLYSELQANNYFFGNSLYPQETSTGWSVSGTAGTANLVVTATNLPAGTRHIHYYILGNLGSS